MGGSSLIRLWFMLKWVEKEPCLDLRARSKGENKSVFIFEVQ